MPKDPKETETPVDESELTEVFASIDPMQMRMARDLLESSGVECFVFDRENSRMFGSSPSFPIRLMVRADVAEDARTRLKDLGFPE
jgi:hypothetical protein